MASDDKARDVDKNIVTYKIVSTVLVPAAKIYPTALRANEIFQRNYSVLAVSFLQ